MLIESLVIKKDKLTTVQADYTIQDALDVLEKSGYRCVPILDKTGQIFRGNIYKSHIYRHKANGGDMSLPVTDLLKNTTKTIQIDSPFFKVFFNIKDLPYIAVLDEKNTFFGILTHSKLLDMLSDAWNMNLSSYVLTVLSDGKQGDLALMSKIIGKYVSIGGCMTLDAKEDVGVKRRTLFTLPIGTSSEILEKISKKLNRKGFKVIEVDDLQSGTVLSSEDN
ncbi:cyclic di-AMP binding protein CbpA [Lactobacillus sp. YT155]|uniref:cyclic di-AMP binding protein CbpA n=1 Tax=Lactobacillus sp. YT155 TaxID=3060955 RepID=UPI00265E070E|nr:cyclic di-AMP binding protein CbpA [Lactobacillus sp. YT155]MDO1604592.1 cyclic di-AMP binding protein CbpA [Lactobacillus sp. YT155]